MAEVGKNALFEFLEEAMEREARERKKRVEFMVMGFLWLFLKIAF